MPLGCDVVEVAAELYFKGAKDLKKFSDQIRRKIGKHVDDEGVRAAFSKAAERYRANSKTLDHTKAQLADEVAKAVWKHASFPEKAGRVVVSAASVPRTITTSFDVSMPGRQGLFAMANQGFRAITGDKAAAKAIPEQLGRMFKGLGEANAERYHANITTRPNADLYRQAGIDILAPTGEVRFNPFEETIVRSVANKVPGVDASQRAAVTFLNETRANLFDSMVEPLQKAEHKFTPEELKTIGDAVNVMTGRGDLGSMNKASGALAKVFFSPRLMKSRIDYLLKAPVQAVKGAVSGDPVKKAVAKAYAQSWAGMATLMGTAGALLTQLPGVEMPNSKDATRPDFMKLKIGKGTYIDLLGGVEPYIRLAARLGTGKTTNMQGRVRPVNLLEPGKFGQTSGSDLVGSFLRGKEAPVPSEVHSALAGKYVEGTPWSPGRAVVRMATPMSVRDILEAADEESVPVTAIAAMASLLGFGVQQMIPPSQQQNRYSAAVRRELTDLLGEKFVGKAKK